jgi:DNA-binding transcriptional LysR family regulator
MKNATLRQLRVFESAARHLSLTRAAEELHLTPPAVSIQIRQLEGHANAKLFERVGRRLRLTQAGEEVLARTREVLAQIRGAEEAIAGLGSLERGLLDVATINAGDYFFPWLIAAFRERHRGIRVRLSVGNRLDLLERLANHEIDLAVMSHPPADEAFVAEPFAPRPIIRSRGAARWRSMRSRASRSSRASRDRRHGSRWTRPSPRRTSCRASTWRSRATRPSSKRWRPVSV